MTINMLDIDIAKNTFQLHGTDRTAKLGSQTLCITSSGVSSAIARSKYS
jgi:hypothetical protein